MLLSLLLYVAGYHLSWQQKSLDGRSTIASLRAPPARRALASASRRSLVAPLALLCCAPLVLSAPPDGWGDESTRWRLIFAESRRSVMVNAKESPEHGWQSVTTSAHFFTPFRVIRDAGNPEQYELYDHLSGGVIRIYGIPAVPGETTAARRLFLSHGRRRRPRMLHGAANSTPAPPPPPLVAHMFKLKEESKGGVSLLPMEDPSERLTIKPGLEFVCEEVRRNVTSGETVLALVVQRMRTRCAHRILLERIAVADMPAADGERTSKAKNRKLVKTVLQRMAFDVGGRSTVLFSAFNLEDIDWAPLSLRWLAANGLRKLVLLYADGFACSATRTLGVQEVTLECLTPEQLNLPVDDVWKGELTPDWGLSARPLETTLLQRAKVKLMEVAVKEGFDVIYVDVDLLVMSPHFVADVASHTADIAFGSDKRTIHNRDFLIHPERCPASLPGYRPYVHDWIDTGLIHVRGGSKPALAFLREVQVLMDSFVLSDADAAQAILTGHAQLSDPLRSPRSGGDMLANETWTKPLWLQTSDFVSGRIQRRGLAGQPGIKPLNAPLTPARWAAYQEFVRTKGLKWHVFDQATHGNGPVMVENWANIFARGLGSTRFDGTRSARLLSVHVNCATKSFLEGGPGSFLFRPEPFSDTVALATHDFPDD